MHQRISLTVVLLLLAAAPGRAQSLGEEPGFSEAARGIDQELRDSLAELDQLREDIATEKIPLSEQLTDLEARLSAVRLEYQQTTRLLDSRTLDLSKLTSDIKTRKDENSYLSNLLDQYIRNFDTRLHISELKRYQEPLEHARLAPENSNLSEQERYQAQASLLDVSLARLEEALGGTRFEGMAVDPSGLVDQGTFVLIGPAALFRSADGIDVGTAEQRLGSLEPAAITFEDPLDRDAAAAVVVQGQGKFPLDTTLGNAHKIAATEDSQWEEIQKGGVVMVPIFAMASAAFLVALYKWLALAFLRKPGKKRVQELLAAVARQDEAGAAEAVQKVKGPAGRMLTTGVEHMAEPRELVEEVMYENVLTTKLKLQSMLPFIAVCAASAPLLGLLGTVTGIINTFKLITVFGSGDVKMLSGGISEALITTKFGLIVAIPSLLLHAFLSRKVRGIVGRMETLAVAFVNQISKNPIAVSTNGKSAPPTFVTGDEPAPAPVAAGAVVPGEQELARNIEELGKLREEIAMTTLEERVEQLRKDYEEVSRLMAAAKPARPARPDPSEK